MQVPCHVVQRSYYPILVLLLLEKQFVGSTPIVICSADDRKYLHNGICCNMCPPGDKLERHCEVNADDGVCAPCPEHYYTAVWNYASNCRAINPCNKSHEYILTMAALDGSSDNVCACELGYQYSASGDICLKIREAVVVTLTPPNQGKEHNTDHSTQTLKGDPGFNVSTSPSENRTEPQIPTGITNNDKATKYNISVGLSVAGIVISLIIIGVFLVCYCRKKKMCCFRNRSDENLSRNFRRDSEGYPMPKLSAIKHDDTLEEIDEGTGTETINSSRRTSDDVEQNDYTASLSSGYCDEDSVSMSEEDKQILRKYMKNFVKDLPTEKVLERMSETFDEEDVAEITNQFLDKCKQRRKLIEVLITKGPTAFDDFVKVLEEVCKHLAKVLKKEKRKK